MSLAHEITVPAPRRMRGVHFFMFLIVFCACSLFSTQSQANNTDCVQAAVNITFTTAISLNGNGGDNPICEMFIAVKQILLGKGKALATIAIMAVGAGALFGKVSYPQAMIVVGSIGLLFGADSFIESMGAEIAINFNFGSANYTDPVSGVLGMIVSGFTGASGRAVATVAIAILGLGGIYGKISLTQVLVLVAGIGMVFGAVNIVQVFQKAVEGTLGWESQVASFDLFTTTFADPLGGPFLNVIDFMTGDIGVSIAICCVMAMGFAAMLGKISWPQAMVLATGMALVFGAANVVQILLLPMTMCTNTETDAFTQVICGFMVELQGPMGKTLATLAIIIIGILSMLGKISWELGFVVTIGIALIFGADSIVSLFEAGMGTVTCNGGAVPSAPSTGNAIADILCYIVMIMYGPAGKALATVAVIMIGFGALVGKVSYSQAFVVAIGMAITFGAPQIVGILIPSATISGCTLTGGFSSGNALTGALGDALSLLGLSGC